ncbi:MlaA family lipoprotein [Maridesulfovibrio zosterae]|uniref:MlaA family lipoprotein n=1 Tax=Maridesulfovibrio zosterae TaxID=82171 RepID=UPI000407BA81|nr:VacJ family lipoprotein [Maridesulfovibrio zosterae]
MKAIARHIILICAVLCVSGCADLHKNAPDMTLSPKGFIAPVSRAPISAANRNKEANLDFLEVDDPWEPMNRYIYSFNARFDRVIYLPLTNVYTTVTPSIVRAGVTNSINNLNEVKSFTNGILQASGDRTFTAFSRFLINSSIGILGIMDVASELGINCKETGFGDTLAIWGIPHGPYTVMPLFGPSNVRDTIGWGGDFALLWYEMIWVYDLAGIQDGRTIIGIGEAAVRGVNLRANVPFRYYQTGSPFEYDLIRFLYSKKRELDLEKLEKWPQNDDKKDKQEQSTPNNTAN